MSRNFLTNINLNKNELLNARVQNLSTAPSSPVAGQIYYNTGDNTLRYYNGSSWLTLAQGGSVDSAISAAIDALTTNDIEEGLNLYFTNERAQDAVGNAVGGGLAYNDTTGALSVPTDSSLAIDGLTNAVKVNRTTVDAWYDAAGSASTVAGNLTTHENDTSVHGVSGNVVGTSDAQTLTNKTLGASTVLGADLDADGYKVIGVATPTADTDAANKAYVDNIAAGLTWKASVNLLATSNVALTGTDGTLVIDGHAALDSGDVGYRILLTNQTTDTENGIYVYGVTTGNYALTRSTDADAYGELINATVFVSEGNSYGQSAWTQANHYLTSFANQDWVQFSGAAQITAGDGLTKTGNTINVVGTADRITAHADRVDIATTYAGQSSITTLGTITTGVWNGTDIAIADGGTGASTAAGARSNLGATTKYAASNGALTASSGSVTWTVTHSLGTSDVTVQVRDLTTKALVEVDVVITDSNTVTLSWVSGGELADAYRVVVVG